VRERKRRERERERVEGKMKRDMKDKMNISPGSEFVITSPGR
jgi:hypothetical protein